MDQIGVDASDVSLHMNITAHTWLMRRRIEFNNVLIIHIM